MRIDHVYHQNPCEVTLQVDVKLVEKPGLYPYRLDEFDIYPTLAKKIFLIDGVIGVDIGCKSIMIKKAKVFLWSEMLPAIHEVIRSCAAGDLDVLTPLGFDACKYHMIMEREYHQNPGMMTIHVGQRLTDRMTHESKYNNLLKIVSDLLSINGIESAYLDQYSINISKSSAVDWTEIDPQIDKIVSEYLVTFKECKDSCKRKMANYGRQSIFTDSSAIL